MTVVIEDPALIAELQRRSLATGRDVNEIVADALRLAPGVGGNALTADEINQAMQALGELQFAFQTHRATNDQRTADEIIGYDEHGLPR